MATIRDVASAANVSITTVSRVVNGDPTVHPTLRRVVEQAVQQIGYRPNATARSLRRARSETIAVAVTDLTNPVYTALVHGVESIARERKISLFLCDTRGSPSIQRAQLESLCDRRVDGVIVNAVGPYREHLAPLTEAGIPVVLISRREAGSGYPEIAMEEQAASQDAYRLLIELGHRRIGLLIHRFNATPSGPLTTPQARIAAYHEAHARAALPVDESLIAEALTPREAFDVTVAMLSRPDRPTALVVGTHPYLVECLIAVQELGLEIPEQLSVIAYGDSRWTEAYRPPITVVRTDYAEYGRRAAELLFAISDRSDTERSLRQVADLVVRASCAAPAGVDAARL